MRVEIPIGNPNIPFGHRMPVMDRRQLKKEKVGYFTVWVGNGNSLSFAAEINDPSSAQLPPNTRVLLKATEPGRPSRFKPVQTTVEKLDLAKTDPEYIVEKDNEKGEVEIGVRLIGELGESIFVGSKVWVPPAWFMGKRQTDKPLRQYRLDLRGKLKT